LRSADTAIGESDRAAVFSPSAIAVAVGQLPDREIRQGQRKWVSLSAIAVAVAG
jgi:hypothetical protein